MAIIASWVCILIAIWVCILIASWAPCLAERASLLSWIGPNALSSDEEVVKRTVILKVSSHRFGLRASLLKEILTFPKVGDLIRFCLKLIQLFPLTSREENATRPAGIEKVLQPLVRGVRDCCRGSCMRSCLPFIDAVMMTVGVCSSDMSARSSYGYQELYVLFAII